MAFDRRDFLKLAASAGLLVAAPPLARHARAGERYVGPFWVTIHARGGWDPTLLCDPKGRVDENAESPVNMFFRDEIEQVGAFQVPPVEGHREFFERYQNELLVLNGVNIGTNSHDTGERVVWSGATNNNMPALAAMIAASKLDAYAPPIAFLTNGGYESTGELVAPTRIPSVDALAELAYPHRLDASNADSSLFTEATRQRIADAREGRLDRLRRHSTLPRERRAMNTLYQARASENELQLLTERLPSTLDNSNNALIRQAQVAVAAFSAGLTVSANLSIGGFDTHGNHDASHTPRMQMIVQAVDFLMQEADAAGIADQLYVMVGSDLGRTPWYNDDNGKDHWSVTSMMMMGPGIRGGRVIGGTNEVQEPYLVDPNTMQASSTGVSLTPGVVHGALRRLAGIDELDAAREFSLEGEELDLFS